MYVLFRCWLFCICLIFGAFLAFPTQAVTSSTIITQSGVSGQIFDVGVYGHGGGSGGPNHIWYAFQIVTSTDIDLCGFDFRVKLMDAMPIEYYPTNLKVALINSPLRDINDENTVWTNLADYDFNDFSTGYTTTTISLDTCLPLWLKSATNYYYIAFYTDALHDTTARDRAYQIESTFGATAQIEANWSSGYITDDLWLEYPIVGHPEELAPIINIYGNIKGGYFEGWTGGEFVETNTSTEEGFFTYCENIDLDAGWWSPLVWVLVYLTCPDPRIMQDFNYTVESIRTRVPMGYITIVYDEVVNYETSTNDGLVLEFKAPYAGLATTTLSLNDAYNEIPIDIQDWLDIWIIRGAWLALLIYLLIRGLYFFNR